MLRDLTGSPPDHGGVVAGLLWSVSVVAERLAASRAAPNRRERDTLDADGRSFPTGGWPAHLHTAEGLMLESRPLMLIRWGAQFWDIIGPTPGGVPRTGLAPWVDDQLLATGTPHGTPRPAPPRAGEASLGRADGRPG